MCVRAWKSFSSRALPGRKRKGQKRRKETKKEAKKDSEGV